jgi:hypothetical protein
MPTWTGNGANNNWSTVGNWDTAVPTAATTAVFNNTGGNSNKNVTITGGATCLSLTCTGYTGQMNFANNLTVATSITLGAGMTTSGSGNIIKNGTGTLTSNGVQLSGGITLAGTAGLTHTFGDNWVMTGSFGGNPSITNIVGGGFTASIGGSLTAPAVQGIATTPLLYLLTGTGTLSGFYGVGTATPSIQISSSGIITQATTAFQGVNFIYTTGTYNSTATLTIGGTVANTFNNVSGLLFNSVTFGASAGQNMTLNSNMYVSGNLSTSTVSGIINGAFTIYVSGSITPTTPIIGTGTIEMVGSSNANISAGTIQNNLTINKSEGASVTFPAGGTITWGATGRILTYTAGSLNVSTSTFSILTNNSVTINGMSFYNLTIVGPGTITMNTANNITNNLTLAATSNVTFTGSAGWTCANLVCSNTGRTITLANSSSGASYRTTTSASLTATAALPITMTSDNATTRSLWTLDYGAQQSMIYVSGTRIDSSLGQTIWTFGGLRTDTVNWATGSRPGTSAYTFVN